MGQKNTVASLEIELSMATASAMTDLVRFGGQVDRTTAESIKNLDRIDAAMKGVGDMAAPTAKMVQFADETARSAVSAAREFNRIEKSGEGLLRQLERQNASFGKTREELRGLKAEEQALAAERVGNSDLAARIRAQETELFDKELAMARRLRAEAEATAEERSRAADMAARASEREAEALRSASVAHQQFEAAARRGMAVYRERQAAEAAAAREAEGLANAAMRFRASIDPAAAAQQRFNQEMAEARTLIGAGAISLDDYCAKLRQQQAALDVANSGNGRVVASASAMRQAMAGASYQVQDFATQVSMGANPINAFVVQSGQLAGQFMNVGGKAGAVASFLMGPWGLALQVGLMALAPLVSKLFESGETLGDLLKKKQEDADKSQMQARANDVWSRSLDGVIEKTRTLNDELFRQIQTRGQLDQAKLGQAQTNAIDADRAYTEVLNDLVAASERLNTAIARRDGAAGKDARIAGVLRAAADAAQAEVVRLEREIGRANQNRLSAEAGVRAAEIVIDQRIVKSSLDAVGKATENYQTQLGLLTAARQAGMISRDQYLTRLGQEEVALKKATEAAREHGRVTRDAETASAASVAKMLRQNLPGVRVTSTTGGQHVKGSDHYKGQAVDFVPAGGMSSMSKDEVRRLFQSWGVQIRKNAAGVEQLFGPGDKGHSDHFHVAWTKGKLALDEYKDSTARATKAAREASQVQRELDTDLAEVTRRFDPAQQAANDLAEALGKISALQKAGRITPGQGALYTVEAIRQDSEAQAAARSARAKTLLGIDGDPLADMLDQAKDQQREDISAWFDDLNDQLAYTADRWDLIASAAQRAGQGMSEAFGNAGRALGDTVAIYSAYRAEQERMGDVHAANLLKATTQAGKDRENAKYALATQSAQIGMYGDMAAAAKGFFKQQSTGYKILEGAEKAFRAVQMALAIKSMVEQLGLIGTHVAAKVVGDATMAASDTARAGVEQGNSLATTAVKAVEAVVNAIKSLPFPLNIAAGAATAAAIAALGVSIVGGFGGGKNTLPKANEGTGTVLGDVDAKSESITRAIDQLREVDLLTNTYARQMAASLRSIESQIGGVASLIVRAGDVNASEGVDTGFKANAVGSVLGSIPVIGGILKSLFGTSTKVVGGGLYGGAQSIGSILDDGFDASTYSDVQKKKKLFGITTSTKYKTEYGAADPTLENQFTLILRSFNDAITAAAEPLGVATGDIAGRLRGFVVDIGKIDLQGLTGEEIQEKLSAIFGAAADNMATAAFPGFERFQRVGEGMFETLVRVASTVEAVTNSIGQLGSAAQSLGIDAKLGIADQFDSVGDLTSAVDAYFEAYYTKEEQRAAKLAQLTRVFDSLGLVTPATIAGYRELVEAQNLSTAAGQAAYATLLQLAPAFADLQAAMDGARSAADILAERQDLERKLLEVRGDTAAIRALELAKLDAGNRALQQQIWSIQDGQEAARAADELRKAWTSVGDSIMNEVRRIRGLSGAETGGGFAILMGQFNAATAAARGGDQDAAKTLPGLSQALLGVAAQVASSRQELDRVQAQTAASLEETYGAIGALAGERAASSADAMSAASRAAAQAASTPTAASDGMAAEIRALRGENAEMRRELTAALATIAGNTGRIDLRLEGVTAASGGDAIATVAA